MQKQHIVLVAVLVVLVVVGAGYYFWSQQAETQAEKVASGATSAQIPEGAQVVMLTDKGFVPSDITLKKGETIAFVTNTKNLFWPASNLHPSHRIYPEFDPQEPVQPDEAWSFTFDKVGAWQFHDHLAPYFTGTITVTE